MTNNKQAVTTIGANTQIIFTIKNFFATLSSILALFLAFYFLVVVPRQENTEQHQKELMEQQKIQIDEQFEMVKEQFEIVNNGISKNHDNIDDLSKRFGDLNDAVEIIVNSGGGFGAGGSLGTPAVGINNVLVTSNED